MLLAKSSWNLCAFARALRVAADNLDLVRLHSLATVVHLERHILDKEGPYFVA